MAVLLGAGDVRASLCPSAIEALKGECGSVHFANLSTCPVGYAMVHLGGLVGSALSGDPLGFPGSCDDMRRAANELRHHPNPEQAALDLLLWMIEEAIGSPGFCAMVSIVAGALAERERLTDAEVRGLMMSRGCSH